MSSTFRQSGTFPLRWHLLLLVVGVLAPILVFGGAIVLRLANQERSAIERRLSRAADAMADTLDRDILATQRTLQVLAESEHFDTDNLAGFYADAQRVLRVQPNWRTLILITPDGEVVVNSARPWGEPLPPVVEKASLQEIVRTRKPTVGLMAVGKPDGIWAFPVRVPVIRDGALKYVLTAVVKPEALQPVVAIATPDEEWTRAVVDSAGILAARTREPEKFVGQVSPPKYMAIDSSVHRGLYRDTSLDGRPVYVAFTRAEQSGWAAVVTAPVAYVDGPVRRSTATVIGLGAAVVGISAAGALLFARRVSRSIAAAAEAATAMAHGGSPRVPASRISEVASLGDALATSAELLHRRESERDEHLARAEAVSESLRSLNETLEQRVALRTAQAEDRAAQLRALASQLTRVEDSERRRVAQTLHDHLQQVLVAAKMRLSIAGRNGTDIEAELKRIATLLDTSIEISRSLTVELSPPVLYDLGLGAALRWLAGHVRERHNLSVAVEADPAADPADEAVRAFLFQAVRELLFNVVKHAGVSEAEVSLDLDDDGRLNLSVADRGRGLSPGAFEEGRSTGGGFGLFSIRERLAHLGGTVTVESEPGAGTRITMVLPLHVGVAAGPAQ